MGRPIRKTVILAKLETTYGTDSTPIGTTDALLISNQSINPLVAQNVDRGVLRASLGGSEQLVGSAYVECSFDIEIAGSGTPTTAPAWGKMLRACGFAETTQTASVDYTPISDISGVASTSLTIYYYLDGQLHKLLGARGTFSLEMGVGERPVFRFRFLGRDGGLTAATNPAATLTAWRTPQVVSHANSGDVTLGTLTYTAATGVLSGGTIFPSRGLRVDVGNNVVYQPLLGGETIEITARDCTGALSLDLTAAQAVTAMTDVKANTVTGMGLTHGTTAGNIVVVHAPATQRINPAVEDLNGNAMHTYQLRLVPVSGNDELRIVSR
jgi:hypothetical protein